MTTSGVPDRDEPPAIRQAKAIMQARDIVDRVLRAHRENVAPLQGLIDERVLADLRESTAAAQALVASRYVPESGTAHELAGLVARVHANHKQLADRLTAATAAASIHEMYREVQAGVNVTGRVEITATGEVQLDGADEAAATEMTHVTTSATTSIRPLTTQEWIGAVALLASLNTLISELRRGDLADYGLLLVVIAALITLISLSMPPEG